MYAVIVTIEVKNICKTYQTGLLRGQKKKVLENVSLQIGPGETYGLMGASGCGKSTLGRILTRLISADSGTVTFDGKELLHLPERFLRPYRRRMQILFQHPDTSLNPHMKIIDCLREPYRLYDLPSKMRMDDHIREHIRTFGLEEELLQRRPGQVSGGQIQRVVLARIMLLEPEFIVLDEPTSMLDVSVQAGIMQFLLELQKRSGISYLLISHDLDLVRRCSHRMGILHQGRIIEQGEPEGLFGNPTHPYTRQLMEHFYSINNIESE